MKVESLNFTNARGVQSYKEIKKEDFIPEINIQVTSLPSKSLAYLENTIIKYRPYTFGEIKKVSQSKLSIRDSFELVLSGIETNLGSKYDLTVSDVLYLGLLRKLSTLGSNKVNLPYTCSQCNNKSSHILDIQNDLEFDDIKAPKLPIIAEFSNKVIEFMPITVNKFFYLMDKGLEKDELAIMAIQATNLDFEESYKFFQNITGEDIFLAEQIDQDLYHGLKPVSFECSQCKSKIKFELDGGEALILPFREYKESIKTRIHYGIKA
jgi:hypothetical protein